MNRTEFIKIIQAGCCSMILSPTTICSGINSSGTEKVKRRMLETENVEQSGLPKGKRSPFGWPVKVISPGQSIILTPKERLTGPYFWLRISVALEIFEEKLLHVKIPQTNIYLGAIDIRYSAVLVPYEIEIDGKYASLINQQGLELTLEAPSPFWFFDKPAKGIDNAGFLPCIVDSSVKAGTVKDFLDCFLSVYSVQSFAWREGCVLDGLWQIYKQQGDKRALETIQQHFDLFFDDDENLIYETARSEPKDNKIGGIESTLPFAILAKIKPDHPILKKVAAAWNDRKKENGMITDGMMISAEGCYTVAYPMAVLGKAWGRKDLIKTALDQLKHRFVLIHDKQFYLRYLQGERSFQNWARGVAWFLLGFARTLSELKDEIYDKEVVEKFREGVDIALSFQNQNDLWNCFMHEPDTLPDTSGSAGIAAAILTGIKEGFLPEKYSKYAKACWYSLQTYLTPDGYLKGVAQDNRGGMELQQGDYRVIAQMGMGLMAQVFAEIN